MIDKEEKAIHRRYKASLTVEATIVFFMMITSFAGIMMFFPFLEKQIAVYQTMYESAVHGQRLTIVDTTLARTELVAESYVRWNRQSDNKYIIFQTSETEEDILYSGIFTVNLPVPFLKTPYLMSSQDLKIRKWTGYDRQQQRDEMVYITKTGTVYHKRKDCRHLLISIKEVSLHQVEHCRNESGAKYYACESCARGHLGDMLYITTYGNRYHTLKSCRYLLRYMKEVSLASVKDSYPPCKNCN